MLDALGNPEVAQGLDVFGEDDGYRERAVLRFDGAPTSSNSG